VGLPVRGQDFFVIVGRHLFSFSTLLDGEVGSIPVHATAVNLVAGSVGVEIVCQRTDDLYARWQIETHAFITEAYLSTSTRSAPSRSTHAGISAVGSGPCGLDGRAGAFLRANVRVVADGVLTLSVLLGAQGALARLGAAPGRRSPARPLPARRSDPGQRAHSAWLRGGLPGSAHPDVAGVAARRREPPDLGRRRPPVALGVACGRSARDQAPRR